MSATTIIVNDVEPRRQYTASGGQTVFDFPIPFFETGDLTVWLTPTGQDADDTADLLTITADYTVTGENTQDGGQITLVAPATAGDIVTIERIVDIERLADYQNSGDFLAETLNKEQDTEIFISQQLRQDLNRSVKRSTSSASSADLTLPEPSSLKHLRWNSGANGIENADPGSDFTGDSGDIVYNQGNANAVNTTIEAKLQEFISVKDFGAVGDGVADDSTAFTNAIAAASGSTIFLPPGTYDVTGTFTGNFLSLGGVTITTGTVNYITDIAGNKITYANDVVIGKGSNDSLDNIAIGQNALIDGSLASTLNIAIGTGALQNYTTSGGGEDGSCTAVGRSALQDLTTGYFNDAFGTTAGQSLTTAYNCTFLGRAAGAERAQGYDNVGVGREALYGEIGTAATLHTGHSNTAVGVSACHDVIDGDRNTGVGRSALAAIQSSNDNVALGYAAGNLLTTASGCVLVGGYGGNSGGLDIRTAANQIVLSDGVGTVRTNCDGSGNWFITKFAANIANVGIEHRANGQSHNTVDGAAVMFVNRLTDDGNLVQFYQDSTLEGTISVSGTTVSYNGGHLARWSRFLDNSKPELYKGTVLSNLDEMIVWEGEANEQLNHVKVSDAEGDKDVAGVFVSWDDEDGINDFHMAMTGDMIIRIAQGVSVNRGDLLMSAGDGTAKPQEDDIIRSKTIAKVTSTAISAVYDDGSYAVPCVLMGC